MRIAPNDPFDNTASEVDIQQLAAFGDALMDDAAPPPRNETEATMLHVQRTLASPTDATSISPAIRASIQEAIMQQVGTIPPFAMPASLHQTTASTDRPKHWRPIPPRLRAWSATASLSVMIALVIGLVGVLVALRFDAPGPNPPSTASVGQTIPNPTYPSLPEKCVPNGEPITSNDDVKGKSLSDWPKPIYTPAKAVSYEQGLAIQETYMNFLRCQSDAYPETPVTKAQYTPNSLSYYSDRMRYIIATAQGASTIPAELQEYECEPRDQQILASFPLPVNQTWDLTIAKEESNGYVSSYDYVFSPSDVYYMGDGRYGAIIGQVSTAALRNPEVLTRDDYLQFIAFKKVDDHYFIDESTLVLSPDIEHPIVEHGEGTPVPTKATFPPAKDPACLAM